MSKSGGEAISVIFWIAIVIFAIHACSQKPEDTENYKKGYAAGLDDGRDDTCQDIENAKDSIHSFLQSAGICP